MFNQKQNSLFEVPNSKQSTNSNPFIHEGMKKSSETLSGNMAKKYSTTGNDFVDQFGKLGSYRELRSFEEISEDTQALWNNDPLTSIKFMFFIRAITRSVTLFDGTKTTSVQRGSGLKHEGIMRMVWLHINNHDAFWKNIKLFVSTGSWKDIFQMLQYDLEYHGWDGRVLNWKEFGNLILAGLENPNTSELVKKYLPQIKAKSKCSTLKTQSNTLIGKWICSFMKINYKEYRGLKSGGSAHKWQQLISRKLFDSIDFASVHGRALTQLVSSKFLANNGLEEKYNNWIEAQPVAKYTGYVHELMNGVSTNMKPYQINTINKQFDGLVETGRKNVDANSKFIVVRDTSGSMGSEAKGTKVSCYNIAKALALYFSEFLEGHFANSWIEFNSSAKMHQWKGNTPVQKWTSDKSNYIGNTNFQSVIHLLASIKQNGVEEKDFPIGILCISDGEFDQSELGSTNVESARRKLINAGFSKEYVDNFKIVLWNLQSYYYGRETGEKFETYGDEENVFYFSGYEASIIAFLLGVEKKEDQVQNTPKTAGELFDSAMDQEILNMIRV
ncbi:MAG: DUF2828 family protein [PVC group bacterium]|nr:DUF2828 family protein [PVC group bacterium]